MAIYILNPIAPKCFCEHRNGRNEKSGWMCGNENQFKKDGQCKLDEWCTGPYDKHSATYNHETLCTKGKIR